MKTQNKIETEGKVMSKVEPVKLTPYEDTVSATFNVEGSELIITLYNQLQAIISTFNVQQMITLLNQLKSGDEGNIVVPIGDVHLRFDKSTIDESRIIVMFAEAA